MSGILRWEPPPPKQYINRWKTKADRRDWMPIAAELKAHPLRWGVLIDEIGVRGFGLASNIPRGMLAAFKPAGSFEACARTRPDGLGLMVFARYIGRDGYLLFGEEEEL